MPDAGRPTPLEPGSTIGILGSGQLGRMLAMAAARLGLKTHIYCEESGPAFDVASFTTKAAFDDKAALSRFAQSVGAVTYEFENVPITTARHLASLVPVRPSARSLEVAQDRLTEKQFISALGISVAPFRAIDSAEDLKSAAADFGPAILKTRRLGYDGKGQATVGSPAEADTAWQAVAGKPSVLEKRIAFACELSALVVRAAAGEQVIYDCPRNTHKHGILHRSVVPADIPPGDVARAQAIASAIAEALDYVGVLAVELFYLGTDAPPGDRLMVNEIAPRVHNSGHWTIEACAVSQFENHMRAVAGWPLGSTHRHSDAEMVNLIGEDALRWPAFAAEPGVCLHLYGKREARPGRKMGHVTRLFPRLQP